MSDYTTPPAPEDMTVLDVEVIPGKLFIFTESAIWSVGGDAWCKHDLVAQLRITPQPGQDHD